MRRAAVALGLALGAGLGLGAAALRARAAAPGWELRAADASVEVGARGAVSLTIAPAAGHTVSHDGPVRVDLRTDDGLGLARTRYDRRDAADPAADAPRFDLKLEGRTAGDHVLAIDAHFWLCGRKVCEPVHAHRTVVVHVTAPPPPDAAPAPDAPPAPPDAAPRRRR